MYLDAWRSHTSLATLCHSRTHIVSTVLGNFKLEKATESVLGAQKTSLPEELWLVICCHGVSGKKGLIVQRLKDFRDALGLRQASVKSRIVP